MKKGLLISALFLITLNTIAQNINDDFKSFRREILSNYQEYRKDILDNYAKYLNEVWEEYEAFKGIKKNTSPKPTNVPKVEEINKPDPIRNPEVIPATPQVAPTEEAPSSIPVKPLLPEKTIVPNDTPMKTFSFYGMSFYVPTISTHSLNSVENSTISKIWNTYHKENIGIIADKLSQLSQALGLNDWLQYKFITAYTASVCNKINDRILLEHILLSYLGYDVRLAKSGENLALLIPFRQQVYERNYLVINETRYYVFGIDSHSTESYSSCKIPNNVYTGKPLDLEFTTTILSPTESTYHKYQLSDGRLSISGSVNESAMKMIAHYPLCDIPIYAKSNVLPPFHKELLRQLDPQLKGMTQREAVSALLHFIQHAFKYSTDQQQHGYEKPYFIEENFYYPMNDCEDRAILFAFLVRNLVRLDVHLIQFPGHECTAVSFKDQTIPGDSYYYQGKRYLICDPTYIGADIGHCMPNYIQEQPKIELW